MPVDLCVLFHYGSPDFWDFYRPYFDNIPTPFDLYVTCRADLFSTEESLQGIADQFKEFGGDEGKLIILSTVNRGFDTGPCLLVFDEILSQGLSYRYVLKFHTKTLRHGPIRYEMLHPLLKDRARAEYCMRLLDNPQCGMVGPAKWLLHEDHPSAIAYMREWGFPAPAKTITFFAGTMWWARFDALLHHWKDKNLQAMALSMPMGITWVDSDAHFVERMLSHLVHEQGLELRGVTEEEEDVTENV